MPFSSPLSINLVPATSNDPTRVPNGVYTISTTSYESAQQTFTFKIHTITQARTADLIGKRVISRMMSNGGYQAFGFLATTSELRLWQRFASDENADYVKFCRSMLRFMRDQDDVAYNLLRGRIRAYAGPTQYTVEFSLMCRVCNGGLRTEDDRVAGIHFNGVCTTDLSPSQIRDENMRLLRDQEAEQLRQRQEVALAEVAEMRRQGRGGFSDVPDAIVARLSRSEINPSVIQ
jgi:hypothetical protein